VTPTGATVVVKAVNASAARLLVSADPDLVTGVVQTALAACDANGMVKLVVDGLSPDTRYHYAVGMDGVVRSGRIGSFRTGPGRTADFSFAFGSCCEWPGASTFTAIRGHNPDFFLHMGDLHYGDIRVDDRAAFRAGYDAALAAPGQGALYANVPTVYTWSDHDYGANNSDGTSDSKSAAQATYRQYVPSYPLPSPTGGIYQTFRYGRVRFIATDNRSYKSPHSMVDDADKTMLGVEQKQWFKNTIRTATEPVIVWINENPWISPEVQNSDRWGGYRTERDELARFVEASGKNVAIVSGDMHALAADDGRHSAGRIPVFQAAPLYQDSSVKGGPYMRGPIPATEGIRVQQYGVMQVRDRGFEIALEFTGYRVGEGALLTYTHTFAA
jgi:alkaline phosphatase D